MTSLGPIAEDESMLEICKRFKSDGHDLEYLTYGWWKLSTNVGFPSLEEYAVLTRLCLNSY